MNNDNAYDRDDSALHICEKCGTEWDTGEECPSCHPKRINTEICKHCDSPKAMHHRDGDCVSKTKYEPKQEAELLTGG